MESGSIVLTNEQIAKLKEVESASDRVISPLQSLEDNLHGAVNYLILPLFAFVNAGVVFSGGGGVGGKCRDGEWQQGCCLVNLREFISLPGWL